MNWSLMIFLNFLRNDYKSNTTYVTISSSNVHNVISDTAYSMYQCNVFSHAINGVHNVEINFCQLI